MKFEHSRKSAVAEKNGKFWGREQSDTQLPGSSGWVPIFAAYEVGESAGQLLFEHYHAPKDANIRILTVTTIYDVDDTAERK
jgi:hypothetical protein